MGKKHNWKEILGNLNEEEQINWFKKFIEKEEIVSRTDLYERYPRLGYYFLNFKKESQDKILSSRHNDWYSILGNLDEEEQINWFKKFIEKEEIVSRTDLYEKYPQLKYYFSNLKEESQNEILSSQYNDWCSILGNLDEEEQINWFKKFIEKEEIVSRKDLYKRYPHLKYYFSNLKKESQNEILSSQRNDWYSILGNLNAEEQVDWFEKFIEEEEIVSRKDLNKRYPRLRYYFSNLKEESQDKILSSQRNDWYSILGNLNEEEQVDWFKKFIEEEEIVSRGDLHKKYPRLGYYFLNLKEESQNEILSFQYNDWYSILGNLNEEEQVDWFKKFIEIEGIISRTDLHERYPFLYRYYFLNFKRDNQDKILSSQCNDWYSILGNLNEEEQVDWFKKFIEEEEIVSRTDLHERYSFLYEHYFSSLKRDNQDKILSPRYTRYKDWYSILGNLNEEGQVNWFKKFMEKEGIVSRGDLFKRYPSLYRYYLSNLKEESQNEILPLVCSMGEIVMGKILVESEYSYTTQKKYPDLRGKTGYPLSYDIFIPSKNCLIEFHGVQHFNPNCNWYDEEAIERDKIKYQYAIDHKINLCYITDCIKDYKKYGYFTSVFTDYDKLMEYIDSLPDVDMNIQITTLISQD